MQQPYLHSVVHLFRVGDKGDFPGASETLHIEAKFLDALVRIALHVFFAGEGRTGVIVRVCESEDGYAKHPSDEKEREGEGKTEGVRKEGGGQVGKAPHCWRRRGTQKRIPLLPSFPPSLLSSLPPHLPHIELLPSVHKLAARFTLDVKRQHHPRLDLLKLIEFRPWHQVGIEIRGEVLVEDLALAHLPVCLFVCLLEKVEMVRGGAAGVL